MEFGIVFSDFITQLIFPILGAIIMVALAFLARKLDKKFDTDIFTENMGRIESLAMSGVQFAEEKAASWAKNQQPFTSHDKLNAASKWLMKKAPELDKESAEEWVESVLGYVGLGSSGKKQSGEKKE